MRVAMVNGVMVPGFVEPSSEELGDRERAARERCGPCGPCAGLGYFERGEDPDGPDSGFCYSCGGRGFVNDDPVLDQVVYWACDECRSATSQRNYQAVEGMDTACWSCRLPYDGLSERLPIPPRTIDPITGALPGGQSEHVPLHAAYLEQQAGSRDARKRELDARTEARLVAAVEAIVDELKGKP